MPVEAALPKTVLPVEAAPPKTVLPVEAALPKTVWGQPAPAAVTNAPELASASPPSELAANESAKKLSAVEKTENSSDLEKTTPASLPVAPSWAAAASASKKEPPASAKSFLPSAAGWGKTGNQPQPEETQSASAENSSANPAAYVAPRAPWAKPEAAKSSETVIIAAESLTSVPITASADTRTNVPSTAADITPSLVDQAEQASIPKYDAPTVAEEKPAPESIKEEAVDQADLAALSDVAATVEKVEVDVASGGKVEQNVASEVPLENHIKSPSPSTPKSEQDSEEKVSPSNFSNNVSDSGNRPDTDDVTSVLLKLDLNSNKTDSVTSPVQVSGNSTSSSSKSGSQIKLKYEYKEGHLSSIIIYHLQGTMHQCRKLELGGVVWIKIKRSPILIAPDFLQIFLPGQHDR